MPLYLSCTSVAILVVCVCVLLYSDTYVAYSQSDFELVRNGIMYFGELKKKKLNTKLGQSSGYFN